MREPLKKRRLKLPQKHKRLLHKRLLHKRLLHKRLLHKQRLHKQRRLRRAVRAPLQGAFGLNCARASQAVTTQKTVVTATTGLTSSPCRPGKALVSVACRQMLHQQCRTRQLKSSKRVQDGVNGPPVQPSSAFTERYFIVQSEQLS